ncbi:MAG TPA: FkbM family methyltransferase [Pyrinomonadaceae bacterium]|jgi:FkbM family methyltransferase
MILRKIVKTALWSGLRGKTRLTMFLAHNFSSLQALPIKLPHGETLFADLRLVSTHDLVLGKIVEKNEQSLMQKIVKPGMFVIDIGAHVGVHTVWLSKLVGEEGQVWAFEPQPDCLPSLTKTVDNLPNTKLFPVALSDKNGVVEFYVAKEQSMSGLSNWTSEGTKIECQTRKLDDFLSDEEKVPDFIKCDIEGAEVLCFKGAIKLLSKENAPILLFEENESAFGLGFQVNEAINFLKELKAPEYSFFELENNARLSRIETSRKPHANILAVPKTRINQVNQ